MSRFQLIFTGLLVFCAVVGAALFALVRSGGSEGAPQLSMWGTLPSSVMGNFISEVTLQNRDTVNVRYTAKDKTTFESDLIEALARGQGPDLILLPQDLMVKQLDKFYPIPFETYSERTFKDSFIEGSEIFLFPTGIIGLPFSVDPIIMYWNRDIFSNVGVSLPPTSWTELYALVPKIVTKDAVGNITRSLVAFGATTNVNHAKDMVALLSLQAGTPIVSRSTNGALRSVFSDQGQGLVPAEQAVNFFTEFSDPVKPAYSWNGSLQLDRSAFVAGKLALYFGYASELSGIRAANPNLNFDVAAVPQSSPSRKVSFGNMNAIALLKSSPNLSAGYVVAQTLTSSVSQAMWVSESGYPPIRRELLVSTPASASQAIFYQSALMSKAWLDPNEEATTAAFARLIQNVTSGRMRTSEAVRVVDTEIEGLLR